MSVNVIDDKLINFEVFKDGVRKLGMADVKLPDLNMKTTTLSGAGIAGEIEMPTLGHTESMELELNWRVLNVNAYELAAPKAQDLEIRGGIEGYDAGTGEIVVHKIKINVRTLPKGITMGSFRPMEHTDSTSKMEIIYLQVTVDDERQIEIDKLNYIHYIYGTDYLAKVREALGL